MVRNLLRGHTRYRIVTVPAVTDLHTAPRSDTWQPTYRYHSSFLRSELLPTRRTVVIRDRDLEVPGVESATYEISDRGTARALLGSMTTQQKRITKEAYTQRSTAFRRNPSAFNFTALQAAMVAYQQSLKGDRESWGAAWEEYQVVIDS